VDELRPEFYRTAETEGAPLAVHCTLRFLFNFVFALATDDQSGRFDDDLDLFSPE
jgi:hypothetical protein